MPGAKVYHFVTMVDGVPQCGCGGVAPPDCCMYRAGIGVSASDLPATLAVGAETYMKSGGEYLAPSGTYKIVQDDDEWVLIDEANPGSPSWSSSCLIATYGGAIAVADQFPSSATASFLDGEILITIPITRVSLCVWGGQDEGFVYAVEVRYDEDTTTFLGNVTKFGSEIHDGTKTGNQDTPLGIYGGLTVA